MTFPTPLFRRQASSGKDHQWTPKDEPKQQGEANGDNIRVDPCYDDDKITGYLPEHDLTRRYWKGGDNK
jgi:hypothetical protein